MAEDGSKPRGLSLICCLVLGVSLLTQALYALVFTTRYLDIFESLPWATYAGTADLVWNIAFKLFYLASSFYIVFIMMKVFSRTREKEQAWKLGIWSVFGSLVLSPVVILIFERKFPGRWFLEVGV